MTSIQNTGLKRKTLDKYYTKKKIVLECMKLVKKHVKISANDVCIEPSAGQGSFIPSIKEMFNHYLFYDIEPGGNEIKKLDYLTFDSKILSKFRNKKVHVIGNPPFGRQSSLAIKFIKHSVRFCDSICFVLPRSFKKPTLQKHIPLHFHLVCEHELPSNSFIVNDQEHDVPCVFQIWVKKNTKRPEPKKLIPHNFEFVKKERKHDISFRRVGVNAGHIDTKTETKSIQSHYFIRFSFPVTHVILKKLKSIDFKNKHDTVGPCSISKQELIKAFNIILCQNN